jgi:hypothetical protein
MNIKLLTAVASVAFISTGVAFAQENPNQKQQRPVQERAEPRAPAAAPRNEAAPRAAQMEQRREEPKAGATEMRKPAAAETAPRRQEMKAGETETRQPGTPRAAQTEQRREQPKRGEAETRQPNAAPRAAQTEQHRDQMRNGAAETGKRMDTQRATDAERKGGATTAQHQERGAPRVEGKANISTEHATRIAQVLREQSQPERVNVNIRVGERIPADVVLRPLPVDVVELAPEYRGYDYFIGSDDEIVFVSPESHEIVGMIDYGSGEGPVVAGARPCPVEN